MENMIKTFTQDQVNAIVGERLAKEKAKFESALAEREKQLEEREKALQARELSALAAEKLAAAGLPKELGAVLKYEDEATLEEAVKQLSSLGATDNGNKKLPEHPEQGERVDTLLRNAFRVQSD